MNFKVGDYIRSEYSDIYHIVRITEYAVIVEILQVKENQLLFNFSNHYLEGNFSPEYLKQYYRKV